MKPKNSITTKTQAEEAMAKLNRIDTQLASMDMDEAVAISEVREKHNLLQREAGRPGLEAEKALLCKELEAWAQADCASWGKKSIETPFGSLGFRVGNPAVTLIKRVASKLDVALTLLTQSLPKYTRRMPQIDKEKILADHRSNALDEAALAKCGLKVSQEDEFWIETAASKDLEKAAEKLRAA